MTDWARRRQIKIESDFSKGLLKPCKRKYSDFGTTPTAKLPRSDFAETFRRTVADSLRICDPVSLAAYSSLIFKSNPPPEQRSDSYPEEGRYLRCFFQKTPSNTSSSSQLNNSMGSIGSTLRRERDRLSEMIDELRQYADAVRRPPKLVNYDDSTVVEVGQEAEESFDASFLDKYIVKKESPERASTTTPSTPSRRPEDNVIVIDDISPKRSAELEDDLNRVEQQERSAYRAAEHRERVAKLQETAWKIAQRRLDEEVRAAKRDLLSHKFTGLVLDIQTQDSFPEISEEDVELLKIAWDKSQPHDEVLVTVDGVNILRKDILTLRSLDWLNDEVINCYLGMVARRSSSEPDLPKVHAFATFFYTTLESRGFTGVKRWTRKIDVFAHDIWIVPVHLVHHWCMAIVDVQNKTIEYYDSLGGTNNDVFRLLLSYMAQESVDKKKMSMSTENWKCVRRQDIPYQQNGSDCGMFSCKFAEYASRRADIDFTQQHMPYFRKRMAIEILRKQLL